MRNRPIYQKRRLLQRLQLLTYGINTAAFAQNVTIDANTKQQTIRGFSVMNGGGWIADLTAGQINTDFGTETGARRSRH